MYGCMRRFPCSGGVGLHHLLRENSAASPPAGGQEVAQGSNVRWELWHTTKEEALASVWRDSRAAEEQRKQGREEQKLLDNWIPKVKVLSLSCTRIFCSFCNCDQCLKRARLSWKYSPWKFKPNSEIKPLIAVQRKRCWSWCQIVRGAIGIWFNGLRRTDDWVMDDTP